MITLHHLEYSQSFRILWLLEELGIDYELRHYQRDPKTQLAPADYKALSPLGTAPVITDGDLVLAESSAIIDYIVDKHPNTQLRPEAGASNRMQYLFWFHTAQGSITPLLLLDTLFRVIQARVPFFLKSLMKKVFSAASESFIEPRLATLLVKAEETLAATAFFGGNSLTAADILLSYTIEALAMRGMLTEDYPRCREWLNTVRDLPSYQAALAKDGNEGIVLPL